MNAIEADVSAGWQAAAVIALVVGRSRMGVEAHFGNDAAEELAATAKDPGIPFAVNLGAVAIPKASVAPWKLLPPPWNMPDAPLAGAVKVTAAPGKGASPAPRTMTLSGVA